MLVVDDEPEVGRALARVLTTSTQTVEAFTRPVDAVEAASTGRFDVVVSDIAMPAMSGLELMRAVRAHDLDLPIILLTGAPCVETARRAVEYGAYRYLLKPPNIEELRTAVERAVFVRRIARVRRDASDARGCPSGFPTDLSGLEVAFEVALDRMWMAYQPVVSAKTGRAIAYEALLRSESTALPDPEAIIDAAERLHRLDELGRKVRSIVAAPMGLAPPETMLFVNLHPRDLMDAELVRSDTPLGQIAERVVFEITERASLAETPQAVETIAWLRAQGYRIAVDDMGSGYAGLTSFAILEPDFVKLDMGLIRGVDTSTMKQKLVGSVVLLCSELGVKVVAEGIETTSERDKCIELGVDYLQGFLLARPGRPFPEVRP